MRGKINSDKFRSANIFFLTLLFFGSVLSPTADALSITNFNPVPKLPYEATSIAQDEWLATARSLASDHRELAQIQACDALIGDPTTPPELVRWASLRKVTLYSYASREREAYMVGRQWLLDNPDDPGALQIRYVLAEIVRDRRHANFEPTFEEVMEASNDLFEHHEEHEWEVMDAHVRLAIEIRAARLDLEEEKAIVMEHLDAAERGARKVVDDPELFQDERRAARAQRFIDTEITNRGNPYLISIPGWQPLKP